MSQGMTRVHYRKVFWRICKVTKIEPESTDYKNLVVGRHLFGRYFLKSK